MLFTTILLTKEASLASLASFQPLLPLKAKFGNTYRLFSMV